jgi:hypothetical protein
MQTPPDNIDRWAPDSGGRATPPTAPLRLKILAVVLIALPGCWVGRTLLRIATWEKTDAIVMDQQERRSESISPGSENTSFSYRPCLLYRGRDGGHHIGCVEMASNLYARYQINARTEVYFKPGEPSVLIDDPCANFVPTFFLLPGLLLALGIRAYQSGYLRRTEIRPG